MPDLRTERPRGMDRGTPASPWLIFSSDTDTGIYIKPDGSFGFSFNGIDSPFDDWISHLVQSRKIDALHGMLLRTLGMLLRG